MIKIFIAKHPEEAHFVRGLLQGEGIAAKVCGDGSHAQVWLLQDPQLPRALEALARYSREDDAWPESDLLADQILLQDRPDFLLGFALQGQGHGFPGLPGIDRRQGLGS